MNAPITYGSVCSGIEAATVAVEPLGWQAAWFAEIENFPSKVLAHHYQTVPNLGDMTKIAASVTAGEVAAPDVLVGGTPCQAFSVAGLRAGLSDARGALTLSFVELADAIDTARSVRGDDACVVWWENVPGVLSSKDNAFGCFLAGLAGEDRELVAPGGKWPNAGVVYGPQRTVAWRVLDAQYFGVAQARQRLFVLASGRTGFDPAEVLFEFESDGGEDQAPSCRKGDSSTQADSLTLCRFRRTDNYAESEITSTLTARDYKDARDLVICQDGRVRGLTVSECEALQGFPGDYTNIPYKAKYDLGSGRCVKQVVRATVVSPAGCYFIATNHVERQQAECPRAGMPTGEGYEICREVCGQSAHAEVNAIRLAGKHANGGTLYLEGHTHACGDCKDTAARAGIVRIVFGNPPGNAPDGPRYKALGNSMCVLVMSWIGRRIDQALRGLTGSITVPYSDKI